LCLRRARLVALMRAGSLRTAGIRAVRLFTRQAVPGDTLQGGVLAVLVGSIRKILPQHRAWSRLFFDEPEQPFRIGIYHVLSAFLLWFGSPGASTAPGLSSQEKRPGLVLAWG